MTGGTLLFVAAEVVGVALLGGLIADSRILGDSVASTVSMTDFWQLPLPIRIGFALAMISTVFGLALSCSRAVPATVQSITLIAVGICGAIYAASEFELVGESASTAAAWLRSSIGWEKATWWSG